MNKSYSKFICILALFFVFTACNKDDGGDTYVPLVITTAPDSGEVFQNETLLIAIFNNDNNVPQDGQLSLSTAQTGTVVILNNNTPNNRLDDVVEYTPDGSFTGNDTFQYTICDAAGDNCETEVVTVTVLPFSPVILDLTQVPYTNLSDYNFFEGTLADQSPVYGVLPYEPISPLFSDYAKKKRFLWMPYGTKAQYQSDGELLNFPVGTVLIKTFSYNNVLPDDSYKIIETRLMIKKQDGWIFADYVWNEDQTEATYNLNGGFSPLSWMENGTEKYVNYRIPSGSECFTCHKNNDAGFPIGVKPQNLNSDYDFADGTANQLQKWMDMGYLDNSVPSNINTVVNYYDTSQPLDLRVRSYFDINCASCHSDGGHCDYRSLRFAFNESEDPDNLGICITPDTPIGGMPDAKVVDPGNPENSILYFRTNTNFEEYRMPLLGRTIQHEEGIALIEEWINSLSENCN
ncbi:MAG: hypothetical protein HKN48_07510 [Flavobacteriaceae bacterium]|nr:hypothetical protein [Flavobacteriaceae bacterium]